MGIALSVHHARLRPDNIYIQYDYPGTMSFYRCRSEYIQNYVDLSKPPFTISRDYPF